MAIPGLTGHLILMAVRALGALRTASPPIHPKWVFAAFVLAVLVMAIERNMHAPTGTLGSLGSLGHPVAMAAAGWPDAWGAYRAHLLTKGLAASSIGQYRYRLNTWRHFLWHPPRGRHRKDWWQAGPVDLTAFLARKCQPNHLHAGQPLSQATKAMYSHMIPSFSRHCYGQGLIDADPFASYIPLKQPRPAPRPLDLGQIGQLLAFVEHHPDPRLHLAVALCYYDALRSGEPAELRVEDIELGGEVPRAYLLGKGQQERDWFPLQRETWPPLQTYLGWLAARHEVGDWRDIPAGTPLFQSLVKVGVPIDRSYLTRLLARAMRDAGIRGRPHDLRRSAGNAVAEFYDDNPGPLRAVLRHRGYTSLEAYRVPSLGRVQQYLDAIPVPEVPNPLSPT